MLRVALGLSQWDQWLRWDIQLLVSLQLLVRLLHNARTGVKFAQKLNWSVKTRECYGVNKKRLSEGGIEPVTVWIKDGNFNPKTGRDIILKIHPATLLAD